MEEFLRAYCNHKQDDWAEWLPLAEFEINNTWQASIKTTPFFTDTGRHPTITLSREAAREPDAETRARQVEETIQDVRRFIEEAQGRQKK